MNLAEHWQKIIHKSRTTYEFRLKYVMGPLQKIASLTPWFDRNVFSEYKKSLEYIYKKYLLNKSVLDIGSGLGNLSQIFSNKFGADFYTGLDFSAGMVHDAKKSHPMALFVCGDTTNLPFRDASFDIVHSSRLFHHLPQNGRAVALLEQLRVSRQAVILEDLFGFEHSFWALPHRAYYKLADGSFYRYTLKEWESIITSLKANVIEHIYTDEKSITGRCACWVMAK
jgi:ubiquinone/menaquinone biosynthesis C-methylase UbiE